MTPLLKEKTEKLMLTSQYFWESFYRWNMIKSFLVGYISSGFTEENRIWNEVSWKGHNLHYEKWIASFLVKDMLQACAQITSNTARHSASSIKVEHYCQSSVSLAGHGSSNRIKDPKYTFKSSPHGLRRWPLCGALLSIPVLSHWTSVERAEPLHREKVPIKPETGLLK